MKNIIFTNHKEELDINCDTELSRKCIKDLRIFFSLVLDLSYFIKEIEHKKRKGNIGGRLHMKLS